MGSLSLAANTTGTQNVAVGTGAGQKNTTGSNLTALGYNALALQLLVLIPLLVPAP